MGAIMTTRRLPESPTNITAVVSIVSGRGLTCVLMTVIPHGVSNIPLRFFTKPTPVPFPTPLHSPANVDTSSTVSRLMSECSGTDGFRSEEQQVVLENGTACRMQWFAASAQYSIDVVDFLNVQDDDDPDELNLL